MVAIRTVSKSNKKSCDCVCVCVFNKYKGWRDERNFVKLLEGIWPSKGKWSLGSHRKYLPMARQYQDRLIKGHVPLFCACSGLETSRIQVHVGRKETWLKLDQEQICNRKWAIVNIWSDDIHHVRIWFLIMEMPVRVPQSYVHYCTKIYLWNEWFDEVFSKTVCEFNRSLNLDLCKPLFLLLLLFPLLMGLDQVVLKICLLAFRFCHSFKVMQWFNINGTHFWKALLLCKSFEQQNGNNKFLVLMLMWNKQESRIYFE